MIIWALYSEEACISEFKFLLEIFTLSIEEVVKFSDKAASKSFDLKTPLLPAPVIATLISFLSGSTNIRNRTLILTGTPQGIGYSRIPPVFMKEGDEVIIEIDKIGSLTNKIIKES